MKLKITKAKVWSAHIPDRSGSLARVLTALAQGGINLDCVIARREGKRGKGVVYVTPIKGAKAQRAARTVRVKPSDVATLRVEGPNRAGGGARMTKAIAQTGVNLRGVSALKAGGNFVAYFGFDTARDAAKAAAALKKL
ncbi:MAG: amino acid-binding protein [Tepidisphaeraceae bacterium]